MSATGSWSGRAPAKVNLFLRVLAREEGGHHQIETLFQALELADRVELETDPGGGIAFELSGVPVGALGPDEDNLALRAAAAYRDAARREGVEPLGVRIRLHKRIPHGAGLGGGSSDAAAVLRGMDALHGGVLGLAALLEPAAGLGADVPFFLTPSPLALAWGRGDRLLALPPLPPRDVVLAIPREPIGTPWAYQTLAAHRSATEAGPAGPAVLDLEELASWEGCLALAANAFEEVLFGHRPELARIRDLLRERGAGPALVSGSGSAVFGLFEDPAAAKRAAEGLAAAFPEVRAIRTRTAAPSRPDARAAGRNRPAPGL